MKLITTTLITLIALILVGCGGSSSNPSTAISDVPSFTPSEPVASEKIAIKEGIYTVTAFYPSADLATGPYIQEYSVFVLELEDRYRILETEILNDGTYNIVTLDIDKTTYRSYTSVASFPYDSTVYAGDTADLVTFKPTSSRNFTLNLAGSVYELEFTGLSTDITTGEYLSVTNVQFPDIDIYGSAFIEYSGNYMSITNPATGCVVGTSETVRVKGILYGQNFVGNCFVPFQFISGAPIYYPDGSINYFFIVGTHP